MAADGYVHSRCTSYRKNVVERMDLDRLMQLRIGHVQITHRRADGLVTQELLHVGQTDPSFQQVRVQVWRNWCIVIGVAEQPLPSFRIPRLMADAVNRPP